MNSNSHLKSKESMTPIHFNKLIPVALRFHVKMPYKNNIIFQQIESLQKKTMNPKVFAHLKNKLDTLEQKEPIKEDDFFCNHPIPSLMQLTNNLVEDLKINQNYALKSPISDFILNLEFAFSQLIRNTSLVDAKGIMQMELKIMANNLLQSDKLDQLINDVNQLWHFTKEKINIELKIQFINFKLEKRKVLFKYHAFKKNNSLINGYTNENHTRIFIPSDDKIHAQTTRSFFGQKGLYLGQIVTTTPFVKSNDNQHYDVQFMLKKISDQIST